MAAPIRRRKRVAPIFFNLFKQQLLLVEEHAPCHRRALAFTALVFAVPVFRQTAAEKPPIPAQISPANGSTSRDVRETIVTRELSGRPQPRPSFLAVRAAQRSTGGPLGAAIMG